MLEIILVSIVFAVLLIVIGVLAYSNQKLVNKLMSRNYYDYKVSEEYNKEKTREKIQIPTGPREDLNILNDIIA